MRITESSIIMASSRSYLEEYKKSERMKFWTGDQRPPDNQENNNTLIDASEGQAYKVEISEQAKSLVCNIEAAAAEEIDEAGELSTKDKLKVELIEKFIEIMTGKKIKIRIPERIKTEDTACQDIELQNNGGQQPQRRAGWGFEYDFHERYHEKEITTFEAAGIIRTADGKEIKIDIDVNMSREFMSQKDIQIRAGDAKIDPLVINYDGHSANITQTKYSFDIDCDGQQENIAFAGAGSGFISLDKNGDGVINDGSELFGPQSGNGFEELAKFDIDKNGWIDEGDRIFNELRIWTKDENGNDYFLGLGEMNVGAIYLGNVETQFSINDFENNKLASVARTGIFLREDGTAGTVQHIDLAV